MLRLGDEPGTLMMATRDDAGVALGGGSRLSPSGDQSVEVTTLDSVVATRNVSAIHLDVEGSEERALTGALELIRACTPVLILETVPSETWLCENLIPLG